MNKIKKQPSLTIRRRILLKLRMAIDVLRGLDFIMVVQPEDLGLDRSCTFPSSPTHNDFLIAVLRDLRIDTYDAMLDVGCAKGSAIRCMMTFGFARVDGIELSAQLADIASRNFKKLGKPNVRIFNMDAREFQHYKNYNMFYIFNPAPRPIMADVIARISEQVDRDREITIIYNSPNCHDIIENLGFRKMRDYPYLYGNKINIYTNRPNNCRKLRN